MPLTPTGTPSGDLGQPDVKAVVKTATLTGLTAAGGYLLPLLAGMDPSAYTNAFAFLVVTMLHLGARWILDTRKKS